MGPGIIGGRFDAGQASRPRGAAARKALWTGLLALSAVLPAATACAQGAAYPNRPVRWVVPYPPGGATDMIARPIAQKLTEYLGQQVVVDNRGGANTIVGTEMVARAAPDGHTLLFSTATSLVINPLVYRKLPYEVRDLAPVTLINNQPYALVTFPGLAVNSVADLIALGKAKPNQIAYASTGNGSTAQLGVSLLESMSGARFTHVPYKGNSPAFVDMIAGQVQFTLTGISAVSAHLASGRLRLIAIGAERRLPAHPNLPTIAEAGFPGFWSGTWFSMSTRAGTPRAIIDRLNREVIRALAVPDVKEKLEAQGYLLETSTPEGLAQRTAEDTRRWAKVVRDSNIRLD